MRIKSLLTIIGSSVMAALCIGCAKVPQAEIDAAKTALNQAKAAEADVYVPAQYSAAQDSLAAAMTAIEKQKAASGMSRNYDPIKVTLKAATDLATQAQNSAAAAKEQMKTDASKAIADAQAAIKAAADHLKKAPKGKKEKAAFDAKKAELSAAEAALSDAIASLSNGQVAAAKDKALDAQQKAESLTPPPAKPKAAKPAKAAKVVRKRK
jgi:hypothetical protein